MPAELTTPVSGPNSASHGRDGADDGLLVRDVHLFVPHTTVGRSEGVPAPVEVLPIEIRDDRAPALGENRLDDGKADARGSAGHEHRLLLHPCSPPRQWAQALSRIGRVV